MATVNLDHVDRANCYPRVHEKKVVDSATVPITVEVPVAFSSRLTVQTEGITDGSVLVKGRLMDGTFRNQGLAIATNNLYPFSEVSYDELQIVVTPGTDTISVYVKDISY